VALKTKFQLKGPAGDSYLKLVTAFPLASIKSDEQLGEAQKVMDQLLARGELKRGAELYLDALSDIFAAYEDEHHAIAPASDADMLRHLMKAKGVTQAQLSRETRRSPRPRSPRFLPGRSSSAQDWNPNASPTRRSRPLFIGLSPSLLRHRRYLHPAVVADGFSVLVVRVSMSRVAGISR
jgi:antitoxin component HigA of HigAB toxin-antitoxin module